VCVWVCARARVRAHARAHLRLGKHACTRECMSERTVAGALCVLKLFDLQ
jgi:hypothetical protein